jgi:hypothetical protein
MKKSRKALTVKSLGLTDDVKLSTRFSNTKECFRTVSDRVLGYYVVPGGCSAPVRIAPIWEADTWICYRGRTRSLISSYEVGEYLNAPFDETEPDETGNALARIVAEALSALEHHGASRATRLKRKR